MSAIRAIDEKNKVIRLLLIIIGLLVVGLMHAHFRVMNTPLDYNFWTPPDLSVGGVARANTPFNEDVYSFAFTMLANVQTWPTSGDTEYPEKLDAFRNYFGSAWIASEKARHQADIASYRGRSRTFEFVEDKWSVEPLGSGRYNVTMMVHVVDKFNGQVIRDDYFVYYLRVIPSNVLRSLNPWQMKIKGEYKSRERVKG